MCIILCLNHKDRQPRPFSVSFMSLLRIKSFLISVVVALKLAFLNSYCPWLSTHFPNPPPITVHINWKKEKKIPSWQKINRYAKSIKNNHKRPIHFSKKMLKTAERNKTNRRIKKERRKQELFQNISSWT